MIRRGAAAALLLAALAPAAPASEVLATRTLAPGTVLGPADMRVADPGDADAAARIDALVGLELRRAVYAGRPIPTAFLGAPTLVERNAIVQMDYSEGRLSIRTEGRALDAGAEGARIRVMNLGSRITVTATVIGPDRVTVTP